MNDMEAKQMMARCAEEITNLRRINAELAPKAKAYDSISQILSLLPQPPQGYSEDLVWRLNKEIEEIEQRQADEKGPTSPDLVED